MASFSRLKKITAFSTSMMACAAFLVGAVRVWGVAPEKIWSGLFMIMIALGFLMALSFTCMLIIRFAKKRLRRD